MSTLKELIWSLGQGVDARNPAITSRDLRYDVLENLEPRLNRLYATKSPTTLSSLPEIITNLASYRVNAALGDNLYALARNGIYWIDLPTKAISGGAIYTGFSDLDGVSLALPWHGCLYVTKMFGPLVRVERKTATVVPNGCWGRYGVVANGHLYFGYAGDAISHSAIRTRWSDLDAPEDYTIDPAVSESDFFDLDPDVRQITGVSMQRDRPVVYTEDSIWVAQYIGFPGGFRHEPLISGVGNIFHHAVIRNKEVDFFIGKDNFYALNGLQVIPIGDEIFERFINDVYQTGVNTIRGFLDTVRHQAFWVYTSLSRGNTSWAVVYNYREKKWSERSGMNLTAFYDPPRTGLYDYTPIDSVTSTINSVTSLPDADVQPVAMPQMCAYTASFVFNVLASFGATFSSAAVSLNAKLETCDFYFDSMLEIKEASALMFEWVKTGSPVISLQVGVRKNQNEAITWSSAIQHDTLESLNGFYIKAVGVGRYVRFRLTFTNGVNDYVSELWAASLQKADNYYVIPRQE